MAIRTTLLELDGPGVYSLHEAAELLGQDLQFVRDLIADGLLPVLTAGRRQVITAPSLVQLLSNQART